MSPFCAGSTWIRGWRPDTRPIISSTWLIVTRDPPPTLYTRPWRPRTAEALERRLAARRFQEHLRRLDVVLGIDGEIASPAFPHARLGRQMEDVRPVAQQPVEIGILKTRFDESEARMRARSGQIAFLHRTRT